jgi:hypothetical protein
MTASSTSYGDLSRAMLVQNLSCSVSQSVTRAVWRCAQDAIQSSATRQVVVLAAEPARAGPGTRQARCMPGFVCPMTSKPGLLVVTPRT